MNFSAGITLIELLLVIALVAILGASTTPFLSRFLLQTQFDTTLEKVQGTLSKAQAYAIDGKQGESWGVCLNQNNIRLYSGSCVAPTFVEEFEIASSVSVTGLSDATFSRSGEPNAPAEITVATSLETAQIILTAAGGTYVQ